MNHSLRRVLQGKFDALVPQFCRFGPTTGPTLCSAFSGSRMRSKGQRMFEQLVWHHNCRLNGVRPVARRRCVYVLHGVVLRFWLWTQALLHLLSVFRSGSSSSQRPGAEPPPSPQPPQRSPPHPQCMLNFFLGLFQTFQSCFMFQIQYKL